MCTILTIGRTHLIPGPPNCQVDTGGPHCVRRDHEAAVLQQVRARQAREQVDAVRVGRAA